MTVTLRTKPEGPAGEAPAWSANAALGVVGLFLLPFFIVGLGAATLGARHLLQGNSRDGLFMLLFGLVFAGFPAGLGALLLAGRRKLKDIERLRARYPDQPWLWQTDWAAGRIKDSGRGTLWGSWVFTVFWNSISVPVGFLGVRAAVQEGNNAGYVASLFPLIGVGLLAWAIRNTLRSAKYGTSELRLSTLPGTIGRSIAGVVHIPGQVQPEGGFDVSLTCLRRVTTRSGKNSSTSERILWQEETRASGEQSRGVEGLGVRLPVGFRIPSDVPASDSTNPRDQVVWRLRVAADVPGIDYDAAFEVPVFRTAESDLAETENPDPAARPKPADYQQPANSRISVSTSRRGTEIFFAAGRNLGVATGWTAFTVLWTGVVAVLFLSDVPILFPIVFGLFELLLVLGALEQWLGISRVTADRGTLSIERGYVVPGRARVIEGGQIADITTKIGMQAGSRPYYDIVVVRKDGKRMIAGRGLRNKREAEWLVDRLKTAVGFSAPDPRP